MADYPVDTWLGEGHGGMVGQDMVVVGGFVKGFTTIHKVRALNMHDPLAEWRDLTDLPYLDDAPTHAGFAIVGKKLYICGGTSCHGLLLFCCLA